MRGRAVQYEVLSDIGKKRTLNEDGAAVFTLPNGILLAVIADGMGVHQGGEFASSTAIQIMGDEFTKLEATSFQDTEEWVEWLKETVLYVNRYLYNYANENKEVEGMGTTLEAVLIKDRTCFGAHIGDSRVYKINNEQIEQITTDHSYVKVLVDSGEITEQEAEVHPQRNWIIKALGSERSVEPDCYTLDLKDTAYLLLCSDGLSNKVDNPSIHKIVQSDLSLKEKTKALVDLANKMGGEDNISVILLGSPDSEVPLT